MKKSSAFSLIELSIVILVIGILVAGLTQSSRLVAAIRLNSARAITQSSPVSSIRNLAMWLEATSTKSFATGTTSFTDVEDLDNAAAIGRWNDINPQRTSKYNATQSTSGIQPTYVSSGMNGLPVINFNGSSQYFDWDGSFLASANYTIFVVEQRGSGGGAFNLFICGSAGSTNGNLHLGYRVTSEYLTHAHWSNDIDYTSIPTYSGKIPRMHTFWFSTSGGKQYWLNGGTTADASSSGQTTALVSNDGQKIGRCSATSTYYNGDIAEIIVFDRNLNAEERQSVESYLGKKWRIRIL